MGGHRSLWINKQLCISLYNKRIGLKPNANQRDLNWLNLSTWCCCKAGGMLLLWIFYVFFSSLGGWCNIFIHGYLYLSFRKNLVDLFLMKRWGTSAPHFLSKKCPALGYLSTYSPDQHKHDKTLFSENQWRKTKKTIYLNKEENGSMLKTCFQLTTKCNNIAELNFWGRTFWKCMHHKKQNIC